MSNYPPCPSGVYSLHRLFACQVLTERLLTVGGRLECNAQTNPRLVDAGGKLELPHDFCLKTGAKPHETWLVSFYRRELINKNNWWSVGQVVSASRLTAPLREIDWQLPNENKILAWGPFVDQIKRHLKARGLFEVTTPSLVQNPGMEPELEPFTVIADRKLFLPTSPELHLKQLLALGYTDIFEIKPVFRKEELTDIHEPEFHMLEWYRGYANLDAIADDLLSLLIEIAGIEAKNVRRTTIRELFSFEGFMLRPDTSSSELYNLAKVLELHPSTQMDWNDLFHLIWIAKVEPNLPKEPLFVRDYPPSQAALARLNDHGWADRLEFYWQGIEIANAFHELNNPVVQRERFERDQKKRIEYGRTPLEIDENFMAALEYGLPPSGGIALGVDRFFMLAQGERHLRDLRAFPFSHQFRD